VDCDNAKLNLEFLAYISSNSDASNSDGSNSESRINESALVCGKSVFTNHVVQKVQKKKFSASNCGNSECVCVYMRTV
jgi:hypothetical protein